MGCYLFPLVMALLGLVVNWTLGTGWAMIPLYISLMFLPVCLVAGRDMIEAEKAKKAKEAARIDPEPPYWLRDDYDPQWEHQHGLRTLRHMPSSQDGCIKPEEMQNER